MFAVRPRHQSGGLGRAILEHAEALARAEWSAERIEMTVIRQRHDLIAWYERVGYAPTGATEAFPYGDERFGLPRRPDLEFVVLAKSLAATTGE
jgi:GNAT superfamily N-acetyltransferase